MTGGRSRRVVPRSRTRGSRGEGAGGERIRREKGSIQSAELEQFPVNLRLLRDAVNSPDKRRPDTVTALAAVAVVVKGDEDGTLTGETFTTGTVAFAIVGWSILASRFLELGIPMSVLQENLKAAADEEP